MEEENLKSNPLYKDVLDYLSKSKSKIPHSQALKRQLLIRRAVWWVIIFLIVTLVSAILVLGKNLIKSAPTKNTAVVTSGPKVVCKLFRDLDEALKDQDIACILKLEGQGLTKVPSDITKLNKLTELSLKNNKIATFPAEVLTMTTLITLDLSNNQISSIPDQIANLKNLQRLDLTGNNLSEAERAKVKKFFPQLSITF